MKDVVSAHNAEINAAIVEVLAEILERFEEVRELYAADWGIAYDLQRAQSLIEREVRALSAPEDEEEDGGGSLRIAAIKGEML